MIRVLFFALTVPLWASGCREVEGVSILAKDVAAAVPSFQAIPPETEILPAPLAGIRRVLFLSDLVRLSHKFGLSEAGLPAQVCFEQVVAPLREQDLLPALESALPEGTHVEILSFLDTPVPRGTLQFTRGGLEPSGLWRGRVLYAPGRSVNIWVKVHATQEKTWVEAGEVLPVGKPIDIGQLVVRSGAWSLLDEPPVETLDHAVGRKPLRNIAPGAVLRANLLVEPPLIQRGERVQVRVSTGGALVELEAEVQTPGRLGDLVFLQNPESGRRFQAKVEGKGRVAIQK
jgi:flagella basal body P-ring formation protein FlgA